MSVKINRTGETRINNQGLKMTIVAYRNAHSIDVKFDDGVICKNRPYKEFKRGTIINKNFRKITPQSVIEQQKSRIGETNNNSQGLKMTIIAYRASSDIDVKFDDGSIQSHRAYKEFKRGGILHPNLPANWSKIQQHVGEVGINNTGLKMTIVAYHSYDDIDVQFDDGAIRTGANYYAFSKGTLQSPKMLNLGVERLHQTRKNTQGIKMTVIAYRSSSDLDVQFETGHIVTGRSWWDFKGGQIKHPDHLPNALRKSRIGEVHLSNCGILMQIIEYRNSAHVLVQFDTGYTAWGAYKDAHEGSIGHPFPYQIGNITMNGPAYIYNNEGNFYCFCNKCKKSDIMTVQEMKDHKCIASDE